MAGSAGPKTESAWLVRTATLADLPGIAALCLRSKAVWGYDTAFLAAAEPELTCTAADLDTTAIGVAEGDAGLAAVAQVETENQTADLLQLFVEPSLIRSGLGRIMFEWAVTRAKAMGAKAMTIEADPFAEQFYLRMGATRTGTAPSGSIPGRELPLLRYDIR